MLDPSATFLAARLSIGPSLCTAEHCLCQLGEFGFCPKLQFVHYVMPRAEVHVTLCHDQVIRLCSSYVRYCCTSFLALRFLLQTWTQATTYLQLIGILIGQLMFGIMGDCHPFDSLKWHHDQRLGHHVCLVTIHLWCRHWGRVPHDFYQGH